MAKKDDFDDLDNNIDDWLDDLDDDSFGEKKPESILDHLKEFSKGVLGGVGDTLTDTDQLREAIDKAFPKGYASAFKLAIDAKEATSELYDESQKTLDKVNKELKGAIREATDSLEEMDVKNKRLSSFRDSIINYGKEEDSYRRKSEEEANEEMLNETLLNIFKTQNEEAGKRATVQEAENEVAEKHFIGNQNQLQSLNKNIARIANYNESINYGFQKKSLEIQLRQYYVQTKTFKEVKDHAYLMKDALARLVEISNTPDFIKAEAYRNKQRKASVNALGKRGLGALEALAPNLVKKGKEGLGLVTDATGMLFPMLGGMLGMGGGGESSSRGAGRFLGGYLAKRGIDKISPLLKKAILNNDRLNIGENRANFALGNARSLLRKYSSEVDPDTGLEKGGILRSGAGFLSTLFEKNNETKIKLDDIQSLQESASWIKRDSKTLNDVIPGLLGRIHGELTTIRSGLGFSENKDFIEYDYSIGSFSTNLEKTSGIRNRLLEFDRGAQTSRNESYNFAFEIINKSDVALNKEEEKRVSEIIAIQVSMDQYNDVEPDIARLTNPDTYIEFGASRKLAALIATVYINYFKGESNEADKDFAKRSDYTDKLKELGNSQRSDTTLLQDISDAGGRDHLIRSGVIKEDGTFDQLAYIKSIMGSDVDLDSVTKRSTSTMRDEDKRREKEEKTKKSAEDLKGEIRKRLEKQPYFKKAFKRYDDSKAWVREKTGFDKVSDSQDLVNKIVDGSVNLTTSAYDKVNLFSKRKDKADILKSKTNDIKKEVKDTFNKAKDDIKEKDVVKYSKEKTLDAKVELDKVLDSKLKVINTSINEVKNIQSSNEGFKAVDSKLKSLNETLANVINSAKDKVNKTTKSIKNTKAVYNPPITNAVNEDSKTSLIQEVAPKVTRDTNNLAKEKEVIGSASTTNEPRIDLFKTILRSQLDKSEEQNTLIKEQIELTKEHTKVSENILKTEEEALEEQRGPRVGSAEWLKEKRDYATGGLKNIGGKIKDKAIDIKETGILTSLLGGGPLAKLIVGVGGFGFKLLGKSLGLASRVGFGLTKFIYKKSIGKILTPILGMVGKALGGLGSVVLKSVTGLLGSIGAKIATGLGSMMGKLGATKLGAGALSALKGVGGFLAKGKVGALAVKGAVAAKGVVAGAGAAIAGTGLLPILAGAAAIGAAAYGGYKLYKWATKARFGDVSKYRYAQYGFHEKDKDNQKAIFILEEIMSRNIINEGESIRVIAPKAHEVREALEAFDISISDDYTEEEYADYEVRASNWLEWFNNRFINTFTKHIESLFSLEKHSDLQKVDKLKGEKAFKFHMTTENTRADYNDLTNPFSLEEPLVMDKGAVEEVFRTIKLELERKLPADKKAAVMKESISSTDLGSKAKTIITTDEEGNTITRLETTDETKSRLENEVLEDSSNEFVTGGSKWLNKDLDLDDLDKMGVPAKVKAFDAIKYKVYGLKTLDPNRLQDIIQLDNKVFNEFSLVNNELTFTGELDDIVKAYGKGFGISLLPRKRLDFRSWFINRYLPVATYIANAVYRIRGEVDGLRASDILTHSEQLAVAKKISDIQIERKGWFKDKQVSIWEFRDSPWVNYTLNTDPRTILLNISALEELAKNSKILEEGKDFSTVDKEGDSVLREAEELGNQLEERDRKNLIETKIGIDDFGNVIDNGNTTYNHNNNSSTSNGYSGSNSNFNVNLAGAEFSAGDTSAATGIPKPENVGGGKNASENLANLKETMLGVSKATGVPTEYLAALVGIETSMGKNLKAGTSTAKGLGQFVDDTWKGMVNKYGSKYNIDPKANPTTDHVANLLMTAEYLKENKRGMEKYLNRPVNFLDLYLAHFLGPGGAKNFLRASDSDSSAKHVSGRAINANAGIFGSHGNIKTVGEVKKLLINRFSPWANAIANNGLDASLIVGGNKAATFNPTTTTPTTSTGEGIVSNETASYTSNNTPANSAVANMEVMADALTGPTNEEFRTSSMNISNGVADAGAVSGSSSYKAVTNTHADFRKQHTNPNLTPTFTNEEFDSKEAGKIESLIKLALSYVGKLTYLMGGKSLKARGIDCSGFTKEIYKKAWGVILADGAAYQYANTNNPGQAFRCDSGFDFKPGDIIFFKGGKHAVGRPLNIGHVAISLGGKKIVHSSSGKGVNVMEMGPKYLSDIVAGRRIGNGEVTEGALRIADGASTGKESIYGDQGLGDEDSFSNDVSRALPGIGENNIGGGDNALDNANSLNGFETIPSNEVIDPYQTKASPQDNSYLELTKQTKVAEKQLVELEKISGMLTSMMTGDKLTASQARSLEERNRTETESLANVSQNNDSVEKSAFNLFGNLSNANAEAKNLFSVGSRPVSTARRI